MASDNSSRIKLSYFENFYPDEGDFTLVYNFAESKQKFQNKINANFWHELGDILDNTIQNTELKAEWNQLRVNGYCTLKRCCCGTCCTDCCCSGCCPGCFTMNCCRFCCCNGECDCCYGSCKSCLGFRDYFIGGIFLIIMGIMNFWAYLSPNIFGWFMLITGSIMIENHNYSNRIKDDWRDQVIKLLVENIGGLANKYGVQFTMSKYGFFGVTIDMELTNAVRQQETVMLMVQQPQQTATAPVQQIQPTAYAPGHQPAPQYQPVQQQQQPPAYQGYEGGGTYQ